MEKLRQHPKHSPLVVLLHLRIMHKTRSMEDNAVVPFDDIMPVYIMSHDDAQVARATPQIQISGSLVSDLG